MNFQPFGVFVQALRNTSLRLRGWPLISASMAARPVTSAVSPTRRTLRSLQAALLYFVLPERREASHLACRSAPRSGYKEARRGASPRARQNRRCTSPRSAGLRGRGFPCRCSSPDLPCNFSAPRRHTICGRRTEGYGRSGYVRGSVRPDAREPDHLGPLLGFLGNEPPKVGG